MIIALEIENTEDCPYHRYEVQGHKKYAVWEHCEHYDFDRDVAGVCPGLGEEGCPLKVIEQWRLESCATCDNYAWAKMIEACDNMNNSDSETTCSNWKAKDGTTQKL